MAGVRETKKRETRKAIVNAAIRLFSEKGLDGTSMEELAREAGIGKSTIYGYFSTKEDIFLAFCEEEMEFAFGEVAKKNDPDASLIDQLMTLFMSQFRFVTSNREFGRHLMREMFFPPEIRVEKSMELDNRYIDALSEILKRAQERGELREDSDLFLTTGHFYSLYLMILSAWYMGHIQDYEEVEVALRDLLRQAMRGLASADAEVVAEGSDERQIIERVKARYGRG